LDFFTFNLMRELKPTLSTLRKPSWLKKKIPGGRGYSEVSLLIKDNSLNTVCQSAHCPNLGECWEAKTATFMILGNICTRGCRFCDVPKGKPTEYDLHEPSRVADSAVKLGLKHVVITSVNRDDLPDQGGFIWAETIRTTKNRLPHSTVETLIPDMQGNTDLTDLILDAHPDILNHNFETVARLQKPVRGRGNIEDSTKILTHAKSRGFITKTSLMLGMGETEAEIKEMVRYFVDLQIDILTLGQYLSPSLSHYPVKEYIHPDQFAFLREYALNEGIKVCESGPFQRSSFKAHEAAKILKLI